MRILQPLHTGHQGITKCRQRAKISVWWPGISIQLADYVRKCSTCAQSRRQNTELLLPSSLPSLPWQRLAADFFVYTCKSHTYLLVVDYNSLFVELALMTSITCSQMIRRLCSIFSRHGYPDELVTDNETQFSFNEFAAYTSSHGIKHTASSPLFPQSNGMAEQSVQTVKHLVTTSTDPYSALLAYRTTPLENGYSPAQLL